MTAEWRIVDEKDEQHRALGGFLVERYCLYNAPGPLLRGLVMRRGAALWHGVITHEPWPLKRAALAHWESSALEAAGLASIVCGEPIAHASRGVGPIDFYWHGEPPTS